MANSPEGQDELFWLDTRKAAYEALGNPQEFDIDKETFVEKGIRKFKQNPFVPLGAIVTTYVLMKGIYGMRKNNVNVSQFWMRSRIAAQGFTILAMAIGTIYYANTNSTKKDEPEA